MSFDIALADRFGSQVWSYDPTPRALLHMSELRDKLADGQKMSVSGTDQNYEADKAVLEKWHFGPVGIWSRDEIVRFYALANEQHVSHSILNLQETETYFEADCRTLASLMSANGHTHIDLLKIDIEGAEYEVIANLRQDGIRPRILCVEFDEGHNPLDSEAGKRIEKSIHDIYAMGYWTAHRANWDYTFVLG